MTPAEEQTAFYFEIGLAITQWAQVEQSLFSVVANCVSPADRQMLSVGFFAIENFRSKLEFSSSLLIEKFSQSPAIQDWPQLRDRLGRAARKRNKLAHTRVIGYPMHDVVGRRCALVPWPVAELEPAKQPVGAKPPNGALCLRDINGIRFEFFAVNMALTNFGSRLRGEPEVMPKHAEQAKDPMSIAELRKHLRHMLGCPQAPEQ